MGEARNKRRRGFDSEQNFTEKQSLEIDRLEAALAKANQHRKPIPAEKLIELAQKNREPPPQGFKGKVNIYCCDDCHGFIVTKDLDDGTTPFMVNCQQSGGVQCADNCKGYMKSAMYRVPHAHMNHTHEWFYPADLRNVPRHLLDHVSNGGLLLRKVGE